MQVGMQSSKSIAGMSKFKTQQFSVLFPRFSRGFAGPTSGFTLQNTHVKTFPPLLHQLLYA